ncbi:MAG: RNA polymerase sigma-I factor [Thermaerobacter sp.]|nr:RNA polymerase sigma-I factor [Thermaerobacter sp.]
MGLRFGRQRAKEPILLLEAARGGDNDARNQLIHDFTPFALKIASQAAGRFLRPGVDEEVSVALMAMNEAISAYDENKGAFLGFAQTVIRRRLVDYFRRQRTRQPEVVLSELDADEESGESEPSRLDRVAHETWRLMQDEENRRAEIEEFQEILLEFGVSLADLAKLAPKHQDSRDRAIQIGRLVASTPQYRDYLAQRKELLVKGLLQEPGISRKILERHRKYIIAVAVILTHDLPYLRSYLLEQ